MLGMQRFVNSVMSLTFSRGARDDDAADRLNHQVLFGLLLCLGLSSATRQYVGTAIYCWSMPEEFKKPTRRYVNHYCWVHALYHIPFNQTIPSQPEDGYAEDVSYYRMAPVMFLFLAALFRLPHILWKISQQALGSGLDKIVELATEASLMDDNEDRDQHLALIAEYFHRWVTHRTRKEASTRRVLLAPPNPIIKTQTAAEIKDSVQTQTAVKTKDTACWTRRPRMGLAHIYLLIKVLYLLNVVVQFCLISGFLRVNFWGLGWGALTSYLRQGHWQDETTFPRVAHCHYRLRQLYNLQTFTVQCVLAINLFLEKMFLLLWLSLVLALVINLVSWVRSLLLLMRPAMMTGRWRGLFLGLVRTGQATSQEAATFMVMLSQYLSMDGMFVLRLLTVNTNTTLTSELVKQIWHRFKISRKNTANEQDNDQVRQEVDLLNPYKKGNILWDLAAVV